MSVNPANYYRSLDDADAYFANQLFATDWTLATDADKERALLAAARAIDSVCFRGKKLPVFNLLDADPDATQAQIEAADATQAKQWPRDGADFATTIPQSVQTLKRYGTNPTAGTIDVTLTLDDGTEIAITAVAFGATASTIQTAIDAAAAGVITGYTAGDIAVTGGPLTAADIVLTFSGDSVDDRGHSKRPTVVADATFLTDGVLSAPSATATITGEVPDKIFFAQCEEAIRLLAGFDPSQEFSNLTLTGDGVASTRASIDRSGTSPHTAHFFTSPLAYKYLLPFIDGDSNTFGIERASC